MMSVVLSSVGAGLLALLLYQTLTYPLFWVDLIYYLKLRRYGKGAWPWWLALDDMALVWSIISWRTVIDR